ncbi:hypothetical protein [Mesorhizobium sp.]|uniref:hypothetical protein n=1 Tax=Mesorhizobium sp. TaxID=1871066 RepID=UPI00257D3AAB|nr:hypothetical protein [Mesorhizobium sp.]
MRSYPAAQRDIFGDHFFCACKRELGPFDALLGSIGRRPASVGFHGVHEFLTHGGQYRYLMSGETGAGRMSSERTGLQKAARAKIKCILRTWQETGAIGTEERLDSKRNPLAFYVCGEPA